MTTDHERTAVLISTPTETEAVLVVQALQSRGIEAHATGVLTSDFRAEAPGQVKILVRERDLSKAREVLRQVRGR